MNFSTCYPSVSRDTVLESDVYYCFINRELDDKRKAVKWKRKGTTFANLIPDFDSSDSMNFPNKSTLVSNGYEVNPNFLLLLRPKLWQKPRLAIVLHFGL